MEKLLDLLALADVKMQELGLDSESTYEFHNRIQNLMDDIEEAHAELMGNA